MRTSASLEYTSVTVEAGGEAVVALHLRNGSDIVEQYELDIVGPGADWMSVDPSTVSVFPGTEAVVGVHIQPPRTSAVTAGEHSFGIRVTPLENPDEVVVPEGTVEVLAFRETTAELAPRMSHGRGRGRHQVALVNRGNVAEEVSIDGSDQADELRISARPPQLTMEPGQAAYADIRLTPLRRVWRGAPVTHQFSLRVAPINERPLEIDGTYLQEPRIPSALPKAIALLAAAALALVLVWNGPLKSNVRSAAREAVSPAVAAATSAASAAKSAEVGAKSEAAKASSAAGGPKSSSGSTAPPTVKATSVDVPFFTRLNVLTPLHATKTATFTAPAKTTVLITDLYWSNPDGDAGVAQLSIQDQLLHKLGLQDIRNWDPHNVSPIQVKAGQSLTLSVQCTIVGTPVGQTPPPSTCDTGVTIVGTAIQPTGT